MPRITLPRLKTESPDFLHLDALRIIASMGVVAFHWRDWLDLTPAARAITNRIENWAFFVDLFFVVSGFIICHVYATRVASVADFGRFLHKRLARLAPLHWLTLAYVLALGSIALGIGHGISDASTHDLACLAPTALFLHAFGTCAELSFNGPSWSVSAEMGCYLLFPLFLWLYRVKVWLPGAVALLLIIALNALGPFGSRPWYHLTSDGGVLRALPAFGIGMTLYGVRQHLRIPHAGLAMYAALIAFVILGQIGAAYGWVVFDAYLIAALGVAADANGNTGAVTRALAPWGSLTYSTYMLHIPVALTLLSGVAGAVLQLSGAALNAAVVLCVPILLGVSYISFVFIETPARKWLSGRRQPVATAAAAASD